MRKKWKTINNKRKKEQEMEKIRGKNEKKINNERMRWKAGFTRRKMKGWVMIRRLTDNS